MITIFNTGEFNYEDSGIDKPVKYDVNSLIEVLQEHQRLMLQRSILMKLYHP
jgi:hypothetical protein